MSWITVRPLQLGDAEQLEDAQRIMASENYTFAFDYEIGQNFGAYLKLLEEKRHGRGLPLGSVPSTFEVGLFEGCMVARLSVRHLLNEFLLQQGGHIGYAVLPKFRGRGFGSAALRRGLQITLNLGIRRTLVICDEDNPVSRRIIENVGGRYDSSYLGPGMSVPVRRYWFENG